MQKIIFAFLPIVLTANFAVAGTLSENAPNGCGFVDNSVHLVAVFEPNEYTCTSGQFLPANATVCVACPNGYTCNGGTFKFNEYFAQGILYNQLATANVSNVCGVGIGDTMSAVFEPNSHTCSPGYYLPANVDECTICLNDNYCPGGTYTFDETTSQGITPCASGLYAPRGMWENAQCGRILHIGANVLYLRATKKTTPSLNVDINGDGIPDYFGNMSTSEKNMTYGSTTSLRVQFNNLTYSIYDDSADL